MEFCKIAFLNNFIKNTAYNFKWEKDTFMCFPGNFAKFSNILCILVNIQQTLWNNRLFHCIYLKMLNYAATYLKFSIMDSEIKYLPWILNNNFTGKLYLSLLFHVLNWQEIGPIRATFVSSIDRTLSYKINIWWLI